MNLPKFTFQNESEYITPPHLGGFKGETTSFQIDITVFIVNLQSVVDQNVSSKLEKKNWGAKPSLIYPGNVLRNYMLTSCL